VGAKGQRLCLIEPSEGGGEPKLHEMRSLELAKQRREEMLREVERNRLVKALRAARKRRDGGRRSALVWEMKRHAGSFRKLLRRTLKDAG
jgi:hypothetical protein